MIPIVPFLLSAAVFVRADTLPPVRLTAAERDSIVQVLFVVDEEDQKYRIQLSDLEEKKPVDSTARMEIMLSHPMPQKEYIGFKTAALARFKAYRVEGGVLSETLFPVQVGDSVVIDTFYRTRGKVGLLVGGSIRLEIKLETALQKLWRQAPPG